MVLVELGGLALCFPANILFNYLGTYCRSSQDRDLYLPFASIFFTFYPLIISLPEAHFKLIKYTMQHQTSTVMKEDEYFPFAFLICLLSVTACMFLDKFVLKKCSQQPQQENDKNSSLQIISNSNGLLFFLSLSIILQNLVNYFYICIEQNDAQIAKQIFLFLLFSLLINFCFAYLLSEASVDKKSIIRIGIYMNFSLIAGLILSFFFQPDEILLALPCICAGMQLYCSIFICFPSIFSNGQRQNDDKSRYCSILIVFLIIIVYYPLCYSLRI